MHGFLIPCRDGQLLVAQRLSLSISEESFMTMYSSSTVANMIELLESTPASSAGNIAEQLQRRLDDHREWGKQGVATLRADDARKIAAVLDWHKRRLRNGGVVGVKC